MPQPWMEPILYIRMGNPHIAILVGPKSGSFHFATSMLQLGQTIYTFPPKMYHVCHFRATYRIQHKWKLTRPISNLRIVSHICYSRCRSPEAHQGLMKATSAVSRSRSHSRAICESSITSPTRAEDAMLQLSPILVTSDSIHLSLKAVHNVIIPSLIVE